MDGPAVVASPPSTRLRRENPTDLEDLVLELDDADLNDVESSPDSNDYKDMKLPESPSSMPISSEIRDEPCENSVPNCGSEESSDPNSGAIEESSDPNSGVIKESSLEPANIEMVNENFQESLETEIKEEVEMDEAESNESIPIESNTHLLEVEVKKEEIDIKPEIKENELFIENTNIPQDSIDSIDKELDGLLNSDSENLVENMDIKEEDGDSILFEDETMDDSTAKIQPVVKTDVLFENVNEDVTDKEIPPVKDDDPDTNGIISNEDPENSGDKTISNEIISNNIKEGSESSVNASLSRANSIESMNDNDDVCMGELDDSDSNTTSDVQLGSTGDSSREPSDSIPHPKSPEPEQVIVSKSNEMPTNKRQAERDFEEVTKKLKTNSGEKIVNGITQTKKHINGFREDSLNKNDFSMKKLEEFEKKVLIDESFTSKVTCAVQTDEVYKVAREQLAAVKKLNQRPLTVDGNMLEELVMMKVVEYLTLGEQNEKRLDCAALMKKCRFLENSLQQVQKKSQELTKQVEDAKHIIKKLIEDRVACKKPLLPLRVTRSVGLQVCTVGSVNVVSTRQKDLESLRKLTGEAAAAAAAASGATANQDEEKDDIIYVGETPAASKEDENNSKKTGEKSVVSSSKSSTNSTPTQSTAKSRTTHITGTPRTPAAGTPTNKATVPPVPAKTTSNTPDSSTPRKDVTSSAKSEATPCIDLTDTDDAPLPAKTKDQPKPKGISVKPPSALYSPDKLNSAAKSTPAGNSNSASKLNRKSTGDGTSKKVTFAKTVTEPVTSAEHLPKLPATPKYPSDVVVPPKPILRIGKNTSGKSGIMLSWCFENQITPPNIEEYHLFAYQENKGNPGEDKGESCWKKVGNIQALPLPMACFLTQFIEGHTYHFIVRAVNKDKRVGEFSLPGSISLQNPQTSPTTSSSSTPSSSKTN